VIVLINTLFYLIRVKYLMKKIKYILSNSDTEFVRSVFKNKPDILSLIL